MEHWIKINERFRISELLNYKKKERFLAFYGSQKRKDGTRILKSTLLIYKKYTVYIKAWEAGKACFWNLLFPILISNTISAVRIDFLPNFLLLKSFVCVCFYMSFVPYQGGSKHKDCLYGRIYFTLLGMHLSTLSSN